jgi:hypothetical protein
MPADLDRFNHLIINGIINMSGLDENGESDTSCHNVLHHILRGDDLSRLFGELFGNNPFFDGES